MRLGMVIHGTCLDREVVVTLETLGDRYGGHVVGEIPKKDPSRVMLWSGGPL